MGRVDQNIDALPHQMIGESRGTAEATDPDRDRLRCGQNGAAGKRKRDVEVAALGQSARQDLCLRRTAKDQDARHVSF